MWKFLHVISNEKTASDVFKRVVISFVICGIFESILKYSI